MKTYLLLCAILCSANDRFVNDIKSSTVSPHKNTGDCSRTNFATISIIFLCANETKTKKFLMFQQTEGENDKHPNTFLTINPIHLPGIVCDWLGVSRGQEWHQWHLCNTSKGYKIRLTSLTIWLSEFSISTSLSRNCLCAWDIFR